MTVLIIYALIIALLFSNTYSRTVGFWATLAVIAAMIIAYYVGVEHGASMEASAHRHPEELGGSNIN